MDVVRGTQLLNENRRPQNTPDYVTRKHGFLTPKQSRILYLRSYGFTQIEIAEQLGISRASVSMIEGRARRQVLRARQTIQYSEFVQKQHEVKIEIGVRLQQVPLIVLQEADKFGIHLRSNMVEILRQIKKSKGKNLGQDGRLSRQIVFRFNDRGKLTLL
jgi:HTH-type transcriptional regulator, fmd operon transcriptional regulator